MKKVLLALMAAAGALLFGAALSVMQTTHEEGVPALTLKEEMLQKFFDSGPVADIVIRQECQILRTSRGYTSFLEPEVNLEEECIRRGFFQ